MLFVNFPVALLTGAIAVEDELAFGTLGDGWDLTEAAHVRHNPHISFFLVHYNIIFNENLFGMAALAASPFQRC